VTLRALMVPSFEKAGFKNIRDRRVSQTSSKEGLSQNFQVNREGDSKDLVPPTIEDKIGVVPHCLSTDSDMVKRNVLFDLSLNLSFIFTFLFWYLNMCYCDYKEGRVDLEEISLELHRV
ncbi:hypothetical protein CR513_43688, partial [Mucuna pruriens]